MNEGYVDLIGFEKPRPGGLTSRSKLTLTYWKKATFCLKKQNKNHKTRTNMWLSVTAESPASLSRVFYSFSASTRLIQTTLCLWKGRVRTGKWCEAENPLNQKTGTNIRTSQCSKEAKKIFSASPLQQIPNYPKTFLSTAKCLTETKSVCTSQLPAFPDFSSSNSDLLTRSCGIFLTMEDIY